MDDSHATCAYCKGPVRLEEAWIGPATGLPYCPDREITSCLQRFGDRVEMIDYTWRPVAATA